MGKQHELLAVEKNIKNESLRRFKEGINTFQKKSNHFRGHIKRFDSIDPDVLMEVIEDVPIVSTVDEKLSFIFEAAIDAADIIIQKEATNQLAKASIVIDGEVIAKDIPATTLLGLESSLLEWKKCLHTIPTLDPAVPWKHDDVKGCYVSTMGAKTVKEKSTEWQIVAPATKEHKSQVKEIVKSTETGTLSGEAHSSMYTVAKKSEILDRLDNLLNAVKQARSRANDTEVVDINIGHNLTKFIFGD